MAEEFDMSSDDIPEPDLTVDEDEGGKGKKKSKEPKAPGMKKLNEKEFKQAVPMTKEELVKNTSLRNKLYRYANSDCFGEYLKTMGHDLSPKALKDLSTVELQELETKVVATVNSKSNTKFWSELSVAITFFMEKITQRPSIKEIVDLDGFSARVAQNQQFRDCVDQLQIEMGDVTNLSCEKRILLILAHQAMIVSAINKGKKVTAPASGEAPAPINTAMPSVAPAANPPTKIPAKGDDYVHILDLRTKHKEEEKKA